MPSTRNQMKITKRTQTKRAEEIMEAVAKYFKIEMADLTGKSRKYEMVWARHIAMYLMRFKLDLKLKHIEELIKRDHSSVIHGIARVNNELTHPYDERMENDLKNINIMLIS